MTTKQKYPKKKRSKFIQQKFQSIWLIIQRENLDRIIILLVVIVFTSAFAISLVEPELPFFDAIWWSIVTLTTVGYGDISPVTAIGRLIAAIDMFIGIGILATLSATLASILVDKKIMEGLGMGTYSFEEHIILCEWNYRAKAILNELRLDSKTQKTPIVLISNIERKPVEDRDLHFIQGRVSDETLKRANLAKAKTVIILGDDSLSDTDRDAKVILSTLTIESINPNAYTIVELVNQSYVSTCKRANADEIIVSSELSSMLISQAALNHGITNIISDLISAQDGGNQLYKIPPIKERIGSPFIEIFVYMKQAYQCIVVGIQKGEEGEVISNPSTEYRLDAEDYLIVIAEERPQIRS